MNKIFKEIIAKFPENLWMKEETRNIKTGIFEQALFKTARHIGSALPESSEGKRIARLKIAGEIVGRKIASFKDLSDAELWALDQLVTYHKQVAFDGFKAWLEKNYGKQESFL